MPRTRVGILISGTGSNAMALIEAARAEDYPAEIAVVISNKPDAPGLARAEAAGVRAMAIDHKPFGKDREAHERAINAALTDAGVGFIALAGYMRVLTPYFVHSWAGRMINIHPSLLPAFPGLNPQRQALEAGVTESGCTVHWVVEGVDAGEAIGRTVVQVLAGDDEAALTARVLAAEHILYPQCLADAVRGLGR